MNKEEYRNSGECGYRNLSLIFSIILQATLRKRIKLLRFFCQVCHTALICFSISAETKNIIKRAL
jgi:hypothetical protein